MAFPLTEKEFNRRFEYVKSRPNQSNCIGTLLFLTGIKEADWSVYLEEASQILSQHLIYLFKLYSPSWSHYTQEITALLNPGDIFILSPDTDWQESRFPTPMHAILLHPFQTQVLVHRKGWGEQSGIVTMKDIATNYSHLAHAFFYKLK